MNNTFNAFDNIKLAALDLCKAAFHEAGHVVVARYRKLNAAAWVWPVKKVPTRKTRAFAGGTQLEMGATSLDLAVFGWGGILAESLADCPLDDWLPNLCVTSTDWEYLLDELSLTDRSNVRQHCAPWRTLEKTANILEKRTDAVAAKACMLIEDCVEGRYKEDAIQFRSDQQHRTGVRWRSGQWWPRPASLAAVGKIALAHINLKFPRAGELI